MLVVLYSVRHIVNICCVVQLPELSTVLGYTCFVSHHALHTVLQGYWHMRTQHFSWGWGRLPLNLYIYIYIYIYFCFVFLWRCGPTRVKTSSFLRFLDHTQRRITVGRTPLDEWSARRRDLYLTTHNTHNRQTSMPPVGFEPTIAAGERPKTYALYIYIYIKLMFALKKDVMKIMSKSASRHLVSYKEN